MTTQAATRRPQLLQAGIDAFAQPEVRYKILFTIGMLLVFRFAAHIPLPNVDPQRLRPASRKETWCQLFSRRSR